VYLATSSFAPAFASLKPGKRRPPEVRSRSTSATERRSSKRPCSPRGTTSGFCSQCSARNSSPETGSSVRESALARVFCVGVGVARIRVVGVRVVGIRVVRVGVHVVLVHGLVADVELGDAACPSFLLQQHAHPHSSLGWRRKATAESLDSPRPDGSLRVSGKAALCALRNPRVRGAARDHSGGCARGRGGGWWSTRR